MVRYVINFFIAAIWLLVFHAFGGITIQPGAEASFFNQLLTAGFIGLIFVVAVSLVGWVVGVVLIALAVNDAGCLALVILLGWLVVLGSFGFWAVSVMLPGWLVVNTGFWWTFVMGFLICAVRIPQPRQSSSPSITLSSNSRLSSLGGSVEPLHSRPSGWSASHNFHPYQSPSLSTPNPLWPSTENSAEWSPSGISVRPYGSSEASKTPGAGKQSLESRKEYTGPTTKLQSRTCPKCDADIPSDARFCIICGHTL